MSFRCVLAASSPVLASILSSAGALVELQAPCLSGSVLAHLLDYIYTGTLPCTPSHQQYSNLFTAACYLKMDELQRTLESQVNHLQVSGSWTGASLARAWKDAHGGSAATSCSKAERTLQGVNTGGQITISTSRMLPNAEMCRVFRTGTEALHYQSHSARPADPESWLQSADTQIQRSAAENKSSSAKEGETSIMEAAQQLCLTATPGPEEAQAHRRDKQICYAPYCVDSSSRIASPTPSSPHPSCGAVPVIRHSRAATAAEAQTGPPYHLVPKVSGSNGGILEDISTQGSARNGKQILGYGSGWVERAGHDSPPKSSSAEEQTHSRDPHTGPPLPFQGPDTGSIHQCVTDADKQPSLPSLNLSEKHSEDAAVLRHERDHTADDGEDRHKSQPLATFSTPVDNMCGPAFSVVEQSYHAHLHYHCLHQDDTLLPRTADQTPSHPDLSDRASDEDEGGPFSSAAQHFSPADQVLLLDISTKPPELLISYRYDEQADWAPLGQGRSGIHRDGDVAEAVADESGGGPVDGDADAKSTGETPKTAGGQVKDRDDGENYTPRCVPSCVPDSLRAPASPTSSFCTPSAISANMPTIVSPQPSNHHPFQCSMCHRSFSQRGSLNRHMRSHLGIRPFPCPRCPMTFSRQYRVSEHMRVHQRCVLGNDFQKPSASST